MKPQFITPLILRLLSPTANDHTGEWALETPLGFATPLLAGYALPGRDDPPPTQGGQGAPSPMPPPVLSLLPTHGVVWAPAGFITDLASVPRFAPTWGPLGGRGMRAGALHDYLCRSHLVPRQLADRIFRQALIADGLDTARADLMYLGVVAYTAAKLAAAKPGEFDAFPPDA